LNDKLRNCKHKVLSPKENVRGVPPVVLVKKRDGTWRFCVDYHKLNEVTSKDAYPLHSIDDSLDTLEKKYCL